MDTRQKLVDDWDPAAGDAVYVTGYFDPLLASHARRLRELASPGKPLVVFIADPPDPLLPARSRAELVAALACVSAVVLPHPDGRPRQVPAAIHEEDSDLERRRALVADVHRRHAAA